MKRVFLLFAIVVATISSVVAKEVPRSVALEVARAVLGDATRSDDVVVAWDSSTLGSTLGSTRSASAPTFYVITPKLGCGFVIVSGDDRVAPILAYSTRYAVAPCDMLPTNFAAWLRYVDGVVSYARRNDIAAAASTAELWSEVNVPASATLLNTARWSQHAPYNNHCPKDGDQLSLTGCTQTAMAIIMHYNRWPARARGASEPFTTLTKGIEVSSRDLNHAYDWDNMLYDYVECEYNDAEGEAVAVLMADLGHSFKADYAAEATGAMPDGVAMYENYGYSPSCHYAMRDYYKAEAWNELLRSEIEANRPIFYSAYTADAAGHAFVLDGFDDNDHFHVNWGWGGVSNGFFRIDGLILDEYHFDAMHWAFLGVHPVRDGEVDNLLYLSTPGMTTETTEFASGEELLIKGISIANPSVVNFDGYIRVGVCDITGEFKSWASEATALALDAAYATSVLDVYAVVREDICAGDRLRAYYRSQQGDKWHAMLPYADNTQWEIVLRYPTIGQTTSLKFDKTSGIMTIEHDRGVTVTLYMLGSVVEGAVSSTAYATTIDTKQLNRKDLYMIYLERKEVGDSRSYTFTLNDL